MRYVLRADASESIGAGHVMRSSAIAEELIARGENVVFVGYDWDLIDVSRLSDAEKKYLKEYEEKCRELGTTLTPCPL